MIIHIASWIHQRISILVPALMFVQPFFMSQSQETVDPPVLNLDRSGFIQFKTQVGVNYQLLVSSDLKQWIPSGNVIEVTGDEEGNAYQVSYVSEGVRTADVDVNSAEYDAERSSAVSTSAPRFDFRLRCQETYKSIYFENFVENRSRSYEGYWTTKNDTYLLSNMKIRTALKNTHVTDFDSYWIVQGNVLHNDVPYAYLSTKSFGQWMEIMVDYENESLVLERYSTGN